MQRTTIMADEGLLAQLRQVASERQVSLAELIREALVEKARQAQPRPRSLGMVASGHTDTARRSADERPKPRSWR